MILQRVLLGQLHLLQMLILRPLRLLLVLLLHNTTRRQGLHRSAHGATTLRGPRASLPPLTSHPGPPHSRRGVQSEGVVSPSRRADLAGLSRI